MIAVVVVGPLRLHATCVAAGASSSTASMCDPFGAARFGHLIDPLLADDASAERVHVYACLDVGDRRALQRLADAAATRNSSGSGADAATGKGNVLFGGRVVVSAARMFEHNADSLEDRTALCYADMKRSAEADGSWARSQPFSLCWHRLCVAARDRSRAQHAPQHKRFVDLGADACQAP